MLVVDSHDRLIYHPDAAVVGDPLSADFLALIAGPGGSEDVVLAGEKVLSATPCCPTSAGGSPSSFRKKRCSNRCSGCATWRGCCSPRACS
jgi:hypothetical protein